MRPRNRRRTVVEHPSSTLASMRAPDEAGCTSREALTRLVDRLDNLPSIPLVAEKVGQLVNDPRSDARAIAAIMRDDPALTAKVLKLVNSPYFAIPGGVADVVHAISFLGFNTVHQLVLTVSAFKVLSREAGDAARNLFRHALGVAGAAEALAEIVGHPAPAECFTAGMLHDLGKLALLQLEPGIYAQVVACAGERGISLHEAEVEIGLPHHEVLGLRLAKRWRFPLALQAAIGHHHAHDLAARQLVPRHLHATIDLTTLADAICHRKGLSTGDGRVPDLPGAVLERLNLLPSIEEKAHDQLRWKMERSELMMQILAGC
jgi:putative nucleotidyltransferase with HDIG domain